jgi:ABC-2 type transport system ATP-binding protein
VLHVHDLVDFVSLEAETLAASVRQYLQGDLQDIKRDYPRDRLVVRTRDGARVAAEFGKACTVAEKGELLIRLSDPSEKKAVMTGLTEHYDIDEVKVYEPSLNDIFVEYAGREV